MALVVVPALVLLWCLGPAWSGFLLGWAGLVYALVGSYFQIEAERREQRLAHESDLDTLRDYTQKSLENLAERAFRLESRM